MPTRGRQEGDKKEPTSGTRRKSRGAQDETGRPRTRRRKTRAGVHRLNLHEPYDVRWGPIKVTRDFSQNFYDSVPADRFAKDIDMEVSWKDRRVVIRGPVQFDPNLLWRIGTSTKTFQPNDYAGQFGEGFVIATLVAMREHSVKVSARVGDRELEFFFDPVVVDGAEVNELCCRVRRLDAKTRVSGSEVTLSNCPPAILQAFDEGRKLFRYDDNPLFGECLGELPDQGLFLYRSTVADGAIFYRRQKRGPYDLPYIFCHDHQITAVRTDRDRGDLQKKEIRDVVTRSVACLKDDAIETLVFELKQHWVKGHPMLTALAARWREIHGWNGKKKLCFPDGHISKSNWKDDEEVKVAKLVLCDRALATFGMLNSREWRLARSTGKLRPPTPTEQIQFKALADAFAVVHDSPIEGRDFKVFVPDHEADSFEGAYGDRSIVLKDAVFEQEFSYANCVFIHEALHMYGPDGSRSFSDKLTEAIHHVYKHRRELEPIERRWSEARSSGGLAPPDRVEAAPQRSSRAEEAPLPDRVEALERQLAELRDRVAGQGE